MINLQDVIRILNKHKYMGYCLWVMGTDLRNGRYCANGRVSEGVVLTAEEASEVATTYEGDS